METLPCASEVAQMQGQQHQQHQPSSLVNMKRVSLPFGNHSLIDAVITKADDMSQILKSQKLQNDNVAQLVTPNNSMDNLCENVTIPKEVILITLVSQQQALYNPKHELYRSTKSKDEKWSDIGLQVGWTDAQCKAKWKAMRDQYCRELKRNKANKGTVKWKYFKELDFLRPFALARNYRSRSSNRFTNIKIEDTSASLLESCSFAAATTTTVTTTSTPTAGVDKKPDPARLLMNSFIPGQIIQEHPQQDTSWNYLADANGNGVNSATSITVTCEQPNTSAGDALYNEFVECVNAVSQSSTTHNNNHQTNADEEDDDPIHTFLNMESYFEKELITMIQQEDMIYNYSNQNYRNVKLKLEAWDEISRKLKKPVKQCRQKWKALRDQYAREYKRLKTQMHGDAISRWKHYDSLGFLQKYIQQKSLDGDALNMLLPKHDSVAGSVEHLEHSPLRNVEPQPSALEQSSSNSSQLNMSTLPPLTGPHKAELSISMQQPQQQQQRQQQQQQQQQQEVQQPNELCVASYDEMDIVENYINGNVTHDDDDEEDDDDDMEATATSEQPAQQQQQQQQQQHVVSYADAEDPVYIAVSNAITKSEQLAKTNSNLETQQLQQQLQATNDYSQKQEVHTPTSTSARFQTAATTPSTPSQVHFPMGGAVSAPPEEDEIGAFFKAVAMKIRNAHLEPVAFTDLQIDILRVINEALRNH